MINGIHLLLEAVQGYVVPTGIEALQAGEFSPVSFQTVGLSSVHVRNIEWTR